MTGHVSDEDRELLRDMSERASTLYWNSDRSVNSIADDLGLSKGRLYDLIRPLGSEQPCSACGSELVFENRTAREREERICPICDSEGIPVESVRSAAQRYAELSAAAQAGTQPPPFADHPDAPKTDADIEPPPLPMEAKGVFAGFLLGTVAGILVGRYLNR